MLIELDHNLLFKRGDIVFSDFHQQHVIVLDQLCSVSVVHFYIVLIDSSKKIFSYAVNDYDLTKCIFFDAEIENYVEYFKKWEHQIVWKNQKLL